MKKSKWICRYVFLGLLLAISLTWTIYCVVVLGQLNDTASSLEYIDWAVSGSPKATEVLDKIDRFEEMLNLSIIVTGVIAVALIGLIVFHIVSGKVKAKIVAVREKLVEKKMRRKEKPVEQPPVGQPPVGQPPVEQPPVVEVQTAVKSSGYCSYCGKFFEELPAFCSECGHKIEKPDQSVQPSEVALQS